jgi:hypothetical protein
MAWLNLMLTSPSLSASTELISGLGILERSTFFAIRASFKLAVFSQSTPGNVMPISLMFSNPINSSSFVVLAET